MSEIRWGCGCHEVEGKLEVECTQAPLQGEVSSAQHAVAKPFSPKCFRLAALAQAGSVKEPNAQGVENAAAAPTQPEAETANTDDAANPLA